MTLVNNTAAINKALDAWNLKMDPVEGQLPPGAEPETETESAGEGESNQGCGCDVRSGAGGVLGSLGLLALFALPRARRRR